MSYTIGAYAIAQFSTAIISLVLVVLLWNRRHIRGGGALLLMFLAISWWSISAGFEAAAIEQSLKINWSKAAYVGAYISPPLFLLFASFYTNRKFVFTPLRLLALLIIPIMIISMALSNEMHGLIWSDFAPGPPGTNSLIYQHGLFFWIGIAYIFTIIFISSLTLFVFSVKSQKLYKHQNRLVILASIAPIAGSILYVSGLNPFPGFDLTPSSFLITGIALLVAISRQKFLDIIPISHELLINQFDDAVIVMDKNLRIIDLNVAAESMFLIERDAVIGKSAKEVLVVWRKINKSLAREDRSKFEIPFNSEGVEFLQVTVSPLRNSPSKFLGWIFVFEDITRRKNAEINLQRVNTKLENQLEQNRALQRKLKEQAIRDSLTGTYNRSYLGTTLKREIARAVRKSHPLSVFMIDLDHFKDINDTFGHAAGDLVIKSLGKILMEASRECDYVCRFGGDEFFVVMPEMNTENALVRAEKWRGMIKAKHVIFRQKKIAPTISIGIATYPHGTFSAEDIVEAADQALYMAKEDGRNCVRVYDG